MATQQPKFRIKIIYRSAITGQLVSKDYADKNPRTTVKETVKFLFNNLVFCKPII